MDSKENVYSNKYVHSIDQRLSIQKNGKGSSGMRDSLASFCSSGDDWKPKNKGGDLAYRAVAGMYDPRKSKPTQQWVQPKEQKLTLQ